MYRNLGSPDTAIALWSEALVALEVDHRDDHPVILDLLGWLGSVSVEVGDMEGGLAYLTRAVATSEALDPDRSIEVGDALVDLGFGYQVRGELARDRPHEAEAAASESVAMFRALYDEPHLQVAFALVTLGWALEAQGRLDEAAMHHGTALTQYQALVGDDHWATWVVKLHLARTEAARGQLDRARALYEDAFPQLYALRGGTAAMVPNLAGYGALLTQQGECNQAAPYLDEAIELAVPGRGAHDEAIARALESRERCASG